MKRYAYYPGCSLTEGAVEYNEATRKVMETVGAELLEVPDWTCCGASAVEAVSRLLTYTLPARNLALAERELDVDEMLVPCSACYLNLLKVEREALRDKVLLDEINEVLGVEGLSYTGKVRPRHLLDILTDIGRKEIGSLATEGLEGMTVAPYYGCQILRPYPVFDDPERPVSMEPVLEALGAEVHQWDMGGKCCGASLMATKKEVALESVAAILKAAEGADAIATVCPMCQMNLEAYQEQAFRISGQKKPISIVYLPQLMGLAFGLSEKDVLLGKNMKVTSGFLAKARGEYRQEAPEPGPEEEALASGGNNHNKSVNP